MKSQLFKVLAMLLLLSCETEEQRYQYYPSFFEAKMNGKEINWTGIGYQMPSASLNKGICIFGEERIKTETVYELVKGLFISFDNKLPQGDYNVSNVFSALLVVSSNENTEIKYKYYRSTEGNLTIVRSDVQYGIYHGKFDCILVNDKDTIVVTEGEFLYNL